jgi:hypothetical protein
MSLFQDLFKSKPFEVRTFVEPEPLTVFKKEPIIESIQRPIDSIQRPIIDSIQRPIIDSIQGPLSITIDDIEFTLLQMISITDRYKQSVKIRSTTRDNSINVFWVYRSNSELGFWRHCVTEKNVIDESIYFYKGSSYTDYIQSTFIHLELQFFINENIGRIPITNMSKQRMEQECVCYVRVPNCSRKNREVIDMIDDLDRVISELPFQKLHELEKDPVNPLGCGVIPHGVTNDTIKRVLIEFTEELNELYDIINLNHITHYNFEFENIIHSDGDIYCIELKRKVNISGSETNNVLLYFLATKLSVSEKMTIGNRFMYNIKKVCGKDLHVFPFFMTVKTASINEYGVYDLYIPCGIFICKLFDYGYDREQCTLEEMNQGQCTQLYSYIGNRYDNLFPFDNALDQIQETCKLEERVSSYETISSSKKRKHKRRKTYKRHNKKFFIKIKRKTRK